MIYNTEMPNRKPIKKHIKSEQLMFRASKPLASAIRKAAANQRRTVADWLRQTIENALAGRPAQKAPSGERPLSWNEQIDKLTEEGFLVKGTQRKPKWLLRPPPGNGPSGVLDALLEERREGR